MTAVAPPPNFQPIAQVGWSGPASGSASLSAMSADDVSRILSPRKALQRTGSQSSASSSSSAASSSTLAANTYQAALAQSRTNGDTSAHGSRKKSAGRLWPPAKPEPAASSSAGRAPSGSQSAAGGQSVSLFPNMHSQGPFLPSQQQQQQPPMHGHIQQGRGNALAGPHDPTAILYLLPMNGTFERKTITVPYYPDYLRVGRQTNQRSTPTPLNGYFDSKVLSRQHAEIWADHDGRIWIRDVRSSNGTFVDGQRLSQEGRESDPHEIREQSVLELGIDIVGEDQKTVVHHKVAAMVERAGFFNSNDFLDMNFNFNDFEQSTGTGVAANVLPPPLVPMPRGRSGSQGAIGTTSRTGSVTSAATHHFNPNGQNRNLNFWLNPVSMEQIVKRLNSELKAAKQQSSDLRRTGQFLETLTSHENGSRHGSSAPNFHPIGMSNNAHGQGSNAAPSHPTQQNSQTETRTHGDALEPSVPSLRRSETAKVQVPTTSSLASDMDLAELPSLMAALTLARKQLDTKDCRLRDVEELLANERSARESAEQRVHQLELEANGERFKVGRKGAAAPKGSLPDTDRGRPESFKADATTSPTENHAPGPSAAETNAIATRLQQRVELMVLEMDEMKTQMEKYRARAETAEEESAKGRRTLAEMVEKIRASERAGDSSRPHSRPRRKSEHRVGSAAGSGSSASATETGNGRAVEADGADGADGADEADEDADAEALFHVDRLRNGVTLRQVDVENFQKAVSGALAVKSKREDPLSQSAPYASILGVVLIGVGLMTYLNGWQKIDR